MKWPVGLLKTLASISGLLGGKDDPMRCAESIALHMRFFSSPASDNGDGGDT